MKCPKCNYIGFEPADRCRNCGFDFALASPDQPASDLPLREPQPMGPMADFELVDAGRRPQPTPQPRADKRREGVPLDPGARFPTASGTGAGDLPLFGVGSLDDAPLVRPAAPSAPLAVRRSTPSRPRSTPAPRIPDRPPDPSLPLDSVAPLSAAGPPSVPSLAPSNLEVAPLGPRVAAAAIDWLLLLGLDAAVVYFTLRVSRLDVAQVTLLPPAPLAAFLLLLNAGYLTLFTAATGQSIGKMAFGLRVVAADDGPLTLGRALLRVITLIVGALPAGLGLLPVAFDGARRGLHDRLADTRVVRAASS